jgi:hypothetical protein
MSFLTIAMILFGFSIGVIELHAKMSTIAEVVLLLRRSPDSDLR